jgi:hypothetical protein
MIRTKLDTKIGEKMRIKLEQNEVKMDSIETKIEKVEEEFKTFSLRPPPV